LLAEKPQTRVKGLISELYSRDSSHTGDMELRFSQQNDPCPLLLGSKPGTDAELSAVASALPGWRVWWSQARSRAECIPLRVVCSLHRVKTERGHKRAAYFCRKCGRNRQLSLER